MLFNSLGFLVFFAVVIGLYHMPLGWKNKKGMLLAASYLFYGLWNPPLVILLWISTGIDYIAGKRMFQLEDKRKRKIWLALSLVVNLGFLGYFKYGGFLLENFAAFMSSIGVDYQIPEFDIILPMGISFYTFQTMSYTIDLYKRKIQPSRTFLDFALYVTFFPQLVAGPIVRSDELIPQFYEPKRATRPTFLMGLLLLTIGLFEKSVIADGILSPVSEVVFGEKDTVFFLDSWLGVWAFSGQIFFDFAGYSLCAIGIAMTLGIHLPDNFRYPYGAVGFSDFWRRWHISLSSWLRDYLYIPLGGNRMGVHRTNMNLMITMVLGGLWHGASWTFVFWGFLHGLYLGIERFFRGRIELKQSWYNTLILGFLTFTAVNFTWVFFRAQGFGQAWNLIKSMVFLEGGKPVLQYVDILSVSVVTILLFSSHVLMRKKTLPELLKKMPEWLLVLIWGIMIFGLIVSQSSGEQFIYFQF